MNSAFGPTTPDAARATTARARSSREARARSGARDARGFTLVELLVVVTIIAIVAALALPSMTRASLDRRVFTDAATLGELVREARTRAVGRGAAQLLAFTTDATNNAMTVQEWEAVSLNASGGGLNTPVSTCGSPTVWLGTSATASFVDQYAFAGTVNGAGSPQTLEGQAGIVARLVYPYATGGLTVLPDGAPFYLCLTPSGRTLVGNATATVFTPMTQPLGVEMTRVEGSGAFSGTTALIRTVWIPPTGATRIMSR